jgi:hypothetical protein
MPYPYDDEDDRDLLEEEGPELGTPPSMQQALRRVAGGAYYPPPAAGPELLGPPQVGGYFAPGALSSGGPTEQQPFFPGASFPGRNANPFAGLSIEARPIGAHGGEELLGMPDEREQLPAPQGYAVPEPSLRQLAGIPPINAQGQITNNQGEPILADGQPVTFDRFARANLAAGGYGVGMTRSRASAEMAAYNSSLRWGQNGQQATPPPGDVNARLGQLESFYRMAQQDPNLSDQERGHVLNHIYQQAGSVVAQHANYREQQQAQRQKAQAAGLHPDYGTPGGPELDPRRRMELAQAEAALQSVRNDPTLSPAQKVQAHQVLSAKIESLDPAGRYRNGQQPMSPIEQFAAQNIRFYPEHGLAVAIDSKGTPHWQKLETGGKGGKQVAEGFDDLPFDRQHKILTDFMTKYGIEDPQEALQHIRYHESLLRPGGGGQDARNYPDTPAGRAAANVQRDWDAQHRQGLRPLRDVQQEQKAREKQAADQEKAMQRWEADQDKARQKKQADADRLDKSDMDLQLRLEKRAREELEHDAAARAKKAKASGDIAGATPDTVDPQEVHKLAAQMYHDATGGHGYYGALRSEADMTRLHRETLPALIDKARRAGDDVAAQAFENMRTLAQKHPKGFHTMTPQERGHWLVGQSLRRTYDPSVGDLPSYEQFQAEPPPGW